MPWKCPSQVTDRGAWLHDDHPTQLKFEPSQQPTDAAQIGQFCVTPSHVTDVAVEEQLPLVLVQCRG